MDDVVALRAVLSDGGEFFFMTWGRVISTVDREPLVEVISKAGRTMLPRGQEIVSLEVCDTLSEAAGAPLFYEAFFSFCAEPPPYEGDFKAWRARTAEEMRQGKHIYGMGSYER